MGHLFTLIWSHGLGDSSDGFSFLAQHLIPHLKYPTRLVLPNAPIKSITINMGAKMRAWYDIKSISSREDDIDVAGIEESRRLLTQVLDDEIEDLNGASTACFVGAH